MATAREFIARVAEIDGVAGCVLIRSDGMLLGQTIDDPEIYSTLLLLSGSLGQEVLEKAGFSYCRHLCFHRPDKNHFYVCPIDRYLLGIVQRSNACIPEMIEAVYRLVGRVTTRREQSVEAGES